MSGSEDYHRSKEFNSPLHLDIENPASIIKEIEEFAQNSKEAEPLIQDCAAQPMDNMVNYKDADIQRHENAEIEKELDAIEAEINNLQAPYICQVEVGA